MNFPDGEEGSWPRLTTSNASMHPAMNPYLVFRGKKDQHKLEGFMADMLLLIDMRDWPNDASKIVYFRQHLLSPAAQWAANYVKDAGGQNMVFDSFLKAFYDHFYHEPDVHKIFNAISQLSEEKLGIQSLNEKFRKYWSRLPADFMTEKAGIAMYLRLLKPQTCFSVQTVEIKTLKDAMNTAYKTTAISDRMFPEFQLDHDGDTIIAAASKISAGRNSSESYSRPSRGRNQKEMRKGTTQSKEDCVRLQLCFYCKKPGHRLSDCRARKASSNRK